MLKHAAVSGIGAVVMLGMAQSAEERLYIACTITMTYDFSKDRMEATTGREVFAITPQPDRSATYSLPFSCVEGTLQTSLSETEIWFRCEQQFGDATYERFARIDRVTGDYVGGFSRKGQNGLVHYGVCEPAERRF